MWQCFACWKESGCYVSKCPELGVASAGATVSEAAENLKETVELYLENVEIPGLKVYLAKKPCNPSWTEGFRRQLAEIMVAIRAGRGGLVVSWTEKRGQAAFWSEVQIKEG